MDIHKPKPWHGLREFLKEYVIIVVGVLTALAAEQAVELLHWRHLASQARADLVENLEADLVNAAERTAIHPCATARIVELADHLRRPGVAWTGFPLNLAPVNPDTDLVLPEVIHTPRRSYTHAAWDSALASGVLNHMPRDEVDGFARSYVQVANLITFQAEERRLAPELQGLAYDHTLTAQEKVEALRAVAANDRLEQAVETSAVVLLQNGRRLGLAPPRDELADALAQQKHFRGACVREPLAGLPGALVSRRLKPK